MYIRLCVKDGIISGNKMRDICEAFNVVNCFEQRKNYDEYYYRYPVDVTVTLENIQKLMDLNYQVIFYSDI